MSERVEARARRAPFGWYSSAAFRRIVEDVPARQREAVGWVYTCLTATASEAFDGNHQGFGCTTGEIQALSGLSRPTFRKAIQLLESMGLLLRENRTAENGRTVGIRYVLTEPDQGGKNLARGQSSASEVCPPNARPGANGKKEELVPDGTRENAREKKTTSKPVTYRGRTVSRSVVEDAEAALAVFNEMTGRALSTRTGDGRASSMLKQVVGAMLERPEVSRDEWTRAVRNVVSNPPSWLDGQLQIGHVFGPRAVEWALLNDGVRRAASKNGRASMADFARIAMGS